MPSSSCTLVCVYTQVWWLRLSSVSSLDRSPASLYLPLYSAANGLSLYIYASIHVVTHAGDSRCVGRVISGVSLCVCSCSKRRTVWANTKLGEHILWGRISACVDPEVKRSKVKVTGLWSVLPAWWCMSIWLLSFSSYGNNQATRRRFYSSYPPKDKMFFYSEKIIIHLFTYDTWRVTTPGESTKSKATARQADNVVNTLACPWALPREVGRTTVVARV